ncbi:MAG: DNA alkylation repair protein [Muribaculaceae bacterium]|nr:DNA alkylation repair protein [Muribaculaceae bacterium]MDE7154945.1 DNA alkylation repair protein [Muribaculaceae bacterium]MDE7369145.1 DNA alkylation repair protein [Muribaculaceae bacterium]
MNYNNIQLIKREFFAMRNGVIADALRKAGAPYSIVFGLTIPQLVEIAEAIGPNREIAETLHNNTTTRESLMLAPMIYPHEQMDYDTAYQWLAGAQTTEEIDIICHRLVRHLDFAPALADDLIKSPASMSRYAALRLYLNIISRYADQSLAAARDEIAKNDSLTQLLARQIIDEVEFIKQ